MDVSSVSNTLPQPPTTATPKVAESKVEGTTPDNDSDKDDVVSSTSQVNNVTDTVGTQVNITA